ncbi:MAG: hypothetical protein HC805_01720 [Alkalinema sp. RL_2_19]|nr:hypothetical protein [Alkalinema sp. RL_2_19]
MTKRIWLTALATLTFILSMLCGYGLRAQEASPSASPAETAPVDPVPVAPLPGSATEYTPRRRVPHHRLIRRRLHHQALPHRCHHSPVVCPHKPFP